MASNTRIDPSINSIYKSVIDDPLSPFYLHHSDSPELVLVSQLLTGDNYASWYRAMVIALSVKNKLGFVDGSIQKPDNSDSNLLNSWIRNNNIVISWILNSVSKEISASIIFAESALEIWLDLKDCFQQSNGLRIFQLRRELINLCQGQYSVSVYFTKLKALWEELNNFRPQCVCGKCCEGVKRLESYHRMDYVLAFLMGLNDSFAQVRSQILLLDPLPSISKVFSMIILEERQRAIGSRTSATDSSNGLAFVIKSDNNRGVANKNRFNNTNQTRERPFCTACKYHGHTLDTCYKLHGYPPGYKPRSRNQSTNQSTAINQISNQPNPSNGDNKTPGNTENFFQSLDKNQYHQLMAMFASHLSAGDKLNGSHDDSGPSHSTGTCLSISMPHSLISSRCWIVDSGASKHICSNITDFIAMRPIQNSVVTLPNRTHIVVKFCGDVRLSSHLILKDVLFVPEFKFNLLSDLNLKTTIGKGSKGGKSICA